MKTKLSKKWKSIRVSEESFAKFRDFADRHRLSIVDAYDVMVSRFMSLPDSDKQKAIQKSAG